MDILRKRLAGHSEFKTDFERLRRDSAKLVRFTFDRVLAHIAQPGNFPVSGELEQQLKSRMESLPVGIRRQLSEQALARLNANASEKQQHYGIFASLRIQEALPLHRLAAQFSNHAQIKPASDRLRKTLEMELAKAAAEKPLKKLAFSKNNVIDIEPDFGLGPILDDEFNDLEIQPKTLELRLKRVICHEDFKNEWGKDEIAFAAVVHDIYHRQDIKFAPHDLGKFKKGDNRPMNDLLIASIPVAPGTWRDATYTASVYLAEKDFGGFEKAVADLQGLSSHEMRDLFVLLHAVSLFSLLGISVAADKGFDANGLAKAIGIGLGPLVYCVLYLGIVGTLPLALAWLGVVILDQLLAVAGLALLETIGDAFKDDLFPSQAIAFHFGIPDGIGDAGSLDFGSPTRAVKSFTFVQKGLVLKENVAHYDLEFEWRVVPGVGKVAAPPSPAQETEDPELALRHLDKIEHIGVVMLENRSFHQMLGFLANDRGRIDLADGPTTDMFNVLRAKTRDQLCPVGQDCLFSESAMAFLGQDHRVPVTRLENTAIEEDPGHTVSNTEHQIFASARFLSVDNPDTAPTTDDPRDPLARDGFAVDPHWPNPGVRELPLARESLTESADPDERRAMIGFVEDYFSVLKARKNLVLQHAANPGSAEFEAQIKQLRDIMGYYPAEAVPAFDLLATEFAVCDRWYSSYPGNTWVNRTLSLTGKPARQENFAKDIDKEDRDAVVAALTGTEHEDHAKFITDNDMPFDEESFFRILDQHTYEGEAITWAFYSQDMPSLLAVDASYASEFRNRLQGRPNRIRPLDKFFKDAADGKLPQVFWVDPNFMDIGDMRENLGNWDPSFDTDGYGLSHFYDLNTANDDHPPVDITHGQHFVLEIFNALFNSPRWSKTLLIIVYDEHGGFFDPVTPPYLDTEPESPAFRSLGVRVPALVVSPWVGRKLVSHRRFDHASLIKTILLKFCRDANGNIPAAAGPRVTAETTHHLGHLLNESRPRFVESSAQEGYGPGVGSNREPSGREGRSLTASADRVRFPTMGQSPPKKRREFLSNVVEGTRFALRLRRQRDKNQARPSLRQPTELKVQMKEARDRLLTVSRPRLRRS